MVSMAENQALFLARLWYCLVKHARKPTGACEECHTMTGRTPRTDSGVFRWLFFFSVCCCFCIGADAQKRAISPVGEPGAKLFPANCGSCHGIDGRGGERAPDIATRRDIQRLSDDALAKIIHDGVPGTGMPPFASLGAPKIQALVRQLRRLQGEDTASSLPGAPASGKSLFFGRAGCSDCHMVNGAGGFIGSDLSVYARGKAAADIRVAILNPASKSPERGRLVVATTPDGQVLTGMVRNEDNFSLQLQTKDGAFHFLEKSSLRSLERRTESLMPSDYGTRLSAQEINDLISYLIMAGRTNNSAGTQSDGKHDNESEGWQE
jgi:putative heme-binding domain-containing protein